MSRVGRKLYSVYMFFLCIALAMAVLSACGDSSVADADEPTSSLQSSSSNKKSSSSKIAYPESFKPNDKEYPYANIPRIVIYTENKQKIKDRETEIPAKLQIWGKKEAESEVLDLTIRGRGNSSWEMPKKSYKIEFAKKQSMLGMPKDKDWALIANYEDKSLVRNYIAYRLSAALGAYYAPRCEFAELYLNGEYLGTYLLTETIKISKNRINIPENDYSYIVEVDGKYRENEQVVFSDVLTENGIGCPFRVHKPKDAKKSILDTIQNHIQNFEEYLKTIKSGKDNKVEEWLDVEESIKHYWVQEFSKNTDARFYTSVYFTWVKGEKIKMGPVWDFDLAFGNHPSERNNGVENWFLRVSWYKYIFKDDECRELAKEVWNENKHVFESVLDTINSASGKLKKNAKNNFKRWDILAKGKAFDSYDAAVDDLKDWIRKRMQWINSQK